MLHTNIMKYIISSIAQYLLILSRILRNIVKNSEEYCEKNCQISSRIGTAQWVVVFFGEFRLINSAQYCEIKTNISQYCSVKTNIVMIYIFNEWKLVLGLQYVKVKVQTEKFRNTSVSARCRVPYAVEENLRGMNEWMKERQSLGLFIIR